MHAGRAISDCVFHRDPGGRFAAELDLPFGTFLTALGSELEHAAQARRHRRVAGGCRERPGLAPPEVQHVGAFYEMGYQVATLINLAHLVGERVEAANPELAELWRDAYGNPRGRGGPPAATAAIEELQPLLENLYGPEQPRGYANLGRVQERVRDTRARWPTCSARRRAPEGRPECRVGAKSTAGRGTGRGVVALVQADRAYRGVRAFGLFVRHEADSPEQAGAGRSSTVAALGQVARGGDGGPRSGTGGEGARAQAAAAMARAAAAPAGRARAGRGG